MVPTRLVESLVVRTGQEMPIPIDGLILKLVQTAACNRYSFLSDATAQLYTVDKLVRGNRGGRGGVIARLAP